jgi:DNA-binding transcriptional regulator LsrR (DeoR family)
MDPKRLELIAEVAQHYYYEDKTVKEIAAIFETSPSSVSRMLKEAKELKMVEVFIRYPFLTVPSLGQKLQKQLGIKEAYVLPEFHGTYVKLMQRVGHLAARVLEEHLEDGMTLGVSLGFAVGHTARAFTMPRTLRCTVVRLHGASDAEIVEGNNLAQIFSAQLGNQFKFIPSPFIMQNAASCELILSEPSVQDVIHTAEEADIALVGLGALDSSTSTMLKHKLISEQELHELKSNCAVGEICGKYFDSMGKVCNSDFNKRTVSIDINKLRDMKSVIGVAAGESKVEPILGAINGGFINILVTDADTARLLLQQTQALPTNQPKRGNHA